MCIRDSLLAERALAPEVRENGGRGIGNLVEDAYQNPLSTFIFDENVEAGEAVELSLIHIYRHDREARGQPQREHPLGTAGIGHEAKRSHRQQHQAEHPAAG